MIGGVYPVMIGDKDSSTGLYSRYFRTKCHPAACPDISVASVERKLREHLEREGLGLPYKEEHTVKAIVDTVVSNQGGYLQGEIMDAIPAIVGSIERMRDTVLNVPVVTDTHIKQPDVAFVVEKLRRETAERKLRRLSHSIESAIEIQDVDVLIKNNLEVEEDEMT